MQYVIGVDGGSTKCQVKAKDLEGRLLAESVDKTTNHLVIGVSEARRRIAKQTMDLLASFDGKREDCACIVVGAAGIDSPNDKAVVDGLYQSMLFPCPVFCMNDGSVALYMTTGGLGVLAVSGTGSIVVGRNREGKVTRSGGYPVTIFGNEGSSQWIALTALNHASKWVDGSVESSPLIERMHEYFHELDANKLVECSIALRRHPVDSQLAVLVYESAKDGDAAAKAILKNGACALVDVAQTCVRKLGLDDGSSFLAGVWGSVFANNEFFYQYYAEEFARRCPAGKVVFPDGDAADGATGMAADYLRGGVSYIADL